MRAVGNAAPAGPGGMCLLTCRKTGRPGVTRSGFADSTLTGPHDIGGSGGKWRMRAVSVRRGDRPASAPCTKGAIRMTGDEAYHWLIGGARRAADPFDAHVLASILAMAIGEGGAGGKLCAHSGLERTAMRRMAEQMFPGCRDGLEAMATQDPPMAEIEQESVRELLETHASGKSPLEKPLAAMLARRAMEPDHLWQDLGLLDRRELSALLRRHFAPLARQNTGNMKWKRFFYRKICEDEGFALCVAPTCSACDDFEMCFGEETGESRMARVRNGLPAVSPA
ncbi:MAG: nitrogen fixation protein NifQ [Rhodovulum sp.]